MTRFKRIDRFNHTAETPKGVLRLQKVCRGFFKGQTIYEWVGFLNDKEQIRECRLNDAKKMLLGANGL